MKHKKIFENKNFGKKQRELYPLQFQNLNIFTTIWWKIESLKNAPQNK